MRGKVASVTKNGSFPRVDYYYDALGQRIAKTHKPTQYEHTWKTSYYVRDAQGNTLAVYEHTQAIPALRGNPVANTNYAVTQTLTLKEYTLYGSSRLGVHAVNQSISTRTFNGKYLNVSPLSAQLLTPTGSIPAPVYAGWATFAWPCTTSTSITPVTVTLKRYGLVRGQKKYELANHLGNVLAVITDRKIQDVAAAGTFLPCVASYSDYYPFGWEMPGRSSGAAYRYAFNGQEKDGETGFTEFEFRQYDGRVSRFLSLDPIAAQYPWNSPYAFAENRVIDGVDLEGREWSKKTTVDSKTGKTTIVLKVNISVYVNYQQTILTKEAAIVLMEQAKTEFAQIYSLDDGGDIIYKGELSYSFIEKEGSITDNCSINISEEYTVKYDYKTERIEVDDELTNVTTFKQKPINGQTIVAENEMGKIIYGKNLFKININPATKKSGELVPSTLRSVAGLVRSIVHELGHSAGLEHPWEDRGFPAQPADASQIDEGLWTRIKRNLMNSTDNPINSKDDHPLGPLNTNEGRTLERTQLETISNNVQEE